MNKLIALVAAFATTTSLYATSAEAGCGGGYYRSSYRAAARVSKPRSQSVAAVKPNANDDSKKAAEAPAAAKTETVALNTAPVSENSSIATGAPKIAAVDLIAALEPVGRGASMGALGTVLPNGDLDLALTIRTFAIAEGRIHLWVGGGIVWDSDPEAEIAESWVKARPLLTAIGAPVAEALSTG